MTDAAARLDEDYHQEFTRYMRQTKDQLIETLRDRFEEGHCRRNSDEVRDALAGNPRKLSKKTLVDLILHNWLWASVENL